MFQKGVVLNGLASKQKQRLRGLSKSFIKRVILERLSGTMHYVQATPERGAPGRDCSPSQALTTTDMKGIEDG